MADLPSLPIWVDAYLADTLHLDDAEHGRYLRLLMLMWKSPGCRVPNDDAWLARKLGRPVDRVISEIRPLIDEFCQTDGNWITQGRLKREYDFVQKKRAKNTASIKSRWNKEKTSYECNTPTPTPTPIPKDSSLRSESKNPPPPPLGEMPAAGGRREPIRSEPAPDPMEGFEEWYRSYPRKVGRGAAERAWRGKAVQQAGRQALMDGLKRSINSEWQGRDRDKIPHPATWLNGKCWLDGDDGQAPQGRAKPSSLIERCGRLGIDDTVIRRAETRQIMLIEAEAALGRLSDDELRDAIAMLKRGVEPDRGWLMRIRSRRMQNMAAE